MMIDVGFMAALMLIKTMTETTDNMRRRLIFRSDHRGTKEMDLILGTFAKKHVPDMCEEELAKFDEILKENDPNLYNWITCKEPEPDNVKSDLFDRLKKHTITI
ncbi:MAG: succinate dehydrogenase assembly factor 2 [Bdellovibrionales bacterium]